MHLFHRAGLSWQISDEGPLACLLHAGGLGTASGGSLRQPAVSGLSNPSHPANSCIKQFQRPCADRHSATSLCYIKATVYAHGRHRHPALEAVMCPSRRTYLMTACGCVLPALASAQRATLGSEGLPKPRPRIRGEILIDEQALRGASEDFGGAFERSPLAVVRPASIEDVARVVRYGNAHRIRVAMRGRGHCAYGQALAENGLVIDSRPLNHVRWHGDYLDAEAGALWDDVARVALSRGKTPVCRQNTIGCQMSALSERQFDRSCRVKNVTSWSSSSSLCCLHSELSSVPEAMPPWKSSLSGSRSPSLSANDRGQP